RSRAGARQKMRRFISGLENAGFQVLGIGWMEFILHPFWERAGVAARSQGVAQEVDLPGQWRNASTKGRGLFDRDQFFADDRSNGVRKIVFGDIRLVRRIVKGAEVAQYALLVDQNERRGGMDVEVGGH